MLPYQAALSLLDDYSIATPDRAGLVVMTVLRWSSQRLKDPSFPIATTSKTIEELLRPLDQLDKLDTAHKQACQLLSWFFIKERSATDAQLYAEAQAALKQANSIADSPFGIKAVVPLLCSIAVSSAKRLNQPKAEKKCRVLMLRHWGKVETYGLLSLMFERLMRTAMSSFLSTIADLRSFYIDQLAAVEEASQQQARWSLRKGNAHAERIRFLLENLKVLSGYLPKPVVSDPKCQFVPPYHCSSLIATEYCTDFSRFYDQFASGFNTHALSAQLAKQKYRMQHIIGGAIRSERSFYAPAEPKLEEMDPIAYENYLHTDHSETDAMLRAAGHNTSVADLLKRWKQTDKNVVRGVDDTDGMLSVLLRRGDLL
eukprot:TRINITY_DN11945_c0_g1_i2.p2 TRINITY_DN11945_c0_g1~~TRINITY_DN11945_c0_g1_i2.p2  ORF type:complete len:371 (+),score=99.56 TRINITY_DN11945_c0_g1_i2:188-1300(+)